jgi:hypothetical protein
MAITKKLFERRKYKRFQVKSGVVAVLTPRWPHPTMVGDVLDISSNGLALRYIADEAPSDRLSELTLVSPEHRFRLAKLPIRAVSDFEIAKVPFGFVAPRRLGLQFGELTQDQTSQLEYLIGNHTANDA